MVEFNEDPPISGVVRWVFADHPSHGARRPHPTAIRTASKSFPRWRFSFCMVWIVPIGTVLTTLTKQPSCQHFIRAKRSRSCPQRQVNLSSQKSRQQKPLVRKPLRRQNSTLHAFWAIFLSGRHRRLPSPLIYPPRPVTGDCGPVKYNALRRLRYGWLNNFWATAGLSSSLKPKSSAFPLR